MKTEKIHSKQGRYPLPFRTRECVVLFLFCSNLLYGASKLKVTKREAPVQAQFVGGIDIRPSWGTKESSFFTENSAELGFKLGANTVLAYDQQIYTRPSTHATEAGHPYLNDGYVKGSFSNLWKDGSGRVSFGYESRVYVPTSASKRDASFITMWRNYFNFNSTISSVVSMQFSVVPILHIYSEAGSNVAGSGPTANPLFETRFVMGPSFNLTKEISLSAPLYLYITKYHSYLRNAALDGEWEPNLDFEPSLTYQPNANFYMGIAYRTDNILTSDETGTTVGDGIGTGVGQLVFGVSF